MPNWAAYAEAEKRGILPAEKQAAYNEAKRRGLVPGYSGTETAETSGSTSAAEPEQGGYSVGKFFKDLGKSATGAVETVGHVLTSTYSVPLSGLAGILAAPFGMEKAEKVIEGGQKLMTYQPKTESGKLGTKIVNAPFELLGKAGEKAGEVTTDVTKNPALGATVSTVIQAAPVLLAGKSGKVAKVGEKIKTAVGKGMNKGIKPSVSGKQTAFQRRMYERKSESAVVDIVNNKENLEYIDAQGNRTKGGIPENVDQFGQAIEQTKRDIFQQYDALKMEAEGTGKSVDLTPIAAELDSIINDTSVRLTSPETIEYAKLRKEALKSEGAISLTDAQNSVQILNESLNAYYDNRTVQTKGRAIVDELIASRMRKAMDDIIESSTGGGYQALKNRYGALKSIEKDVNHRAVVSARKNPKGFFDLGDIYSGYHAIQAILSKDPVGIAASTGAKAIIERMKLKNNPDRIVKKMFSDVEQAMSDQGTSGIDKRIAVLSGMASEESEQ